MFDYKQLEAINAVLKNGSFQRAAKALGLTQPAISERIRLLENQVGRPLIVRGVVPKPTRAGQELVNHYYRVAHWEEKIIKGWGQNPGGDADPTFIPLSVNFDSLSTWFVSAVEPCLKSGTAILEIYATDQDLTVELLRQGAVLGCITSVPRPPAGCSSTLLGEFSYRCLASPLFFKKYFSKGNGRKAIVRAPAIIYGRDDRLHEQFLAKVIGNRSFKSPPYSFVPLLEGMKQMVLRSLGYALLPETVMKTEIHSGKLVDVFPGHSLSIQLYWQRTEIQTPILDDLSDAIVAESSKVLKKA